MMMSMLFGGAGCPCCLAFLPTTAKPSRFVADAPGAAADRVAARPQVHMPRGRPGRAVGGAGECRGGDCLAWPQ